MIKEHWLISLYNTNFKEALKFQYIQGFFKTHKFSTHSKTLNMRIISISIIIILLTCSCSSILISKVDTQNKNRNSSKKDIEFKRDSLAFELCKIYGLDQGIRNSPGFDGKGKFISSIDSLNFERVIDFIKENGVPNAELVGERNFNQECVQASWMVVLLHNPHRLVKDESCLNYFIVLVRNGQMKSEALILILDKYLRNTYNGNRLVV